MTVNPNSYDINKIMKLNLNVSKIKLIVNVQRL